MTDTLLIQCKSIGQSLFTAIGISPELISGDRGINGLRLGSGNGVNEKVYSTDVGHQERRWELRREAAG